MLALCLMGPRIPLTDSLKMGHPRPIFRLFSSLQTNITTNKCEKMSIQYAVLGFELRTLKYESPHITTRSGLPPLTDLFNRC